jgi:hypothetical protein
MSDPLPLLASFLQENLTPEVDHRQRSIECLMESALAFDQRLLWIGFPARKTSTVLRKLYEKTKPHMPGFWPYPDALSFSPAERAHALETKAREVVIETYLGIPP